jgi:hypothetical protein
MEQRETAREVRYYVDAERVEEVTYDNDNENENE